MKWKWIVTFGFTLLMAPGEVPAHPQATTTMSTTAADDVAYQTVVRRLKAGKYVRVTTDSTRFEMRWAGVSPGGVPYSIFDVESGNAPTSESSDSTVAQWSEIRRIEVRGRATGTGWPIGMVVGALGGVAAAAGLSTSFGGDASAGVVKVGLPFGVIGAIGGGLIGAIIGSAFPKWHVVYKRSNR
jgi:hypothetical protein